MAIARTKKKTTAVAKKKTASPKSKIKKGDKYECGECGIAVVVDDVCGCADTCDLVCCGEQMKACK